MGALVIGVGGHFVEGPRGLKAQTTPPTAVVRVAPGDTLETIAARHGVDLTQLIQRNSLANPDLLQVGQLLQLPPPRGLVPVVPGDTLEGLALRHGTTVAALQRANPAVQPTALQVGQWLQLPAAAAGNWPAAELRRAAGSGHPHPAGAQRSSELAQFWQQPS